MRKINKIVVIDDSDILVGMVVELLQETMPNVNVYGICKKEHFENFGYSMIEDADVAFVDYRLWHDILGSSIVKELKWRNPDILCIGWSSDYSAGNEVEKDFLDAGADHTALKDISIKNMLKLMNGE